MYLNILVLNMFGILIKDIVVKYKTMQLNRVFICV